MVQSYQPLLIKPTIIAPEVPAWKALGYALDPVRHFEVIKNKDGYSVSPDQWQRDVLRKRIISASDPNGKLPPLNTICCTSRQVGKSTVIAVKASNKACYTPNALVIVTAPVERQSKELFRKIKECIKLTPGAPAIIRENQTEMELSNGSRIVCLPGKAEFVAGFSDPSMIIIDEACYAKDNLFSTLSPMTAVSKGEIILISTPFIRQGFFYDIWMSDDPDWARYEVKATEIGRIGPEKLASEKKRLGQWWFNSQYMCKFQEAQGALITEEMILKAWNDNDFVTLIKTGDDPLYHDNGDFEALVPA